MGDWNARAILHGMQDPAGLAVSVNNYCYINSIDFACRIIASFDAINVSVPCTSTMVQESTGP